ncbi:AAA family ATPase [Nocardioides sp. Soil797]|nr:AAA family ATPase [Nocardioides sp. Soil797]
MLTSRDPLPFRPCRIVVAGTSGSGKTTLATRISAVSGLPHTEIDSLFHGPDWTERPEFMADVRALVSEPGWVTEWQYTRARPLLAAAADLLVWLDLPYRVTLTRVVRRTVRRRVRRQQLWNGNVEPPLRTFLSDPDHIVRWPIRTRHMLEDRVPAALAANPHLVGVHLRSGADVEAWLEKLARSRGGLVEHGDD